MKRVILICFILCCTCAAFSQVDSVSNTESTRKATPSLQPAKPKLPQIKAIDSAVQPVTDSISYRDSLRIIQVLQDSLLADSLRKAAMHAVPAIMIDTATYRKYETHPFLPLHKPAIFMIIDYRKELNKDDLFYLMAGVIFILAFIRAAFSKYFRNIFLLFFQTSLRQKQTRDQLLQDILASLLTNLLFIISTGLYITLLIQYKNWIHASFWWLAAGCSGVLLLTYLVKYLFLLFAGWVFNTKEAAGSYIFVVFLVNKVMGVILIPFLLILAFANTTVVEVSLVIAAGLVGILLAYRYWVSYTAIRIKLKVNAMHFFLYLCAVELLPLVLIYKVLINYLDGSF